MERVDGCMSMDEKNLNAKEICSIIRTCAEHGVYRFTLGTMLIEYGKKEEVPAPMTDCGLSDMKWQGDEATSSAMDEIESNHKDELLARMLLEDPVGYEQLLAQGELEDEAIVDEAGGPE